VRPGGLAAQPFRVVCGGDQQQGGGVGADAVQGEQAAGEMAPAIKPRTTGEDLPDPAR
jgi:hypothetical protein